MARSSGDGVGDGDGADDEAGRARERLRRTVEISTAAVFGATLSTVVLRDVPPGTTLPYSLAAICVLVAVGTAWNARRR